MSRRRARAAACVGATLWVSSISLVPHAVYRYSSISGVAYHSEMTPRLA
jgi:hypothetical protein